MIFGKLASRYSLGRDISAGEKRVRFAEDAEDLSEYPPDVLEEAVRRYRRDPENRFYPHSGQLRAICESIVSPIRRDLKTIQRLIAAKEAEKLKAPKEKIPDNLWGELISTLKGRVA